MHQNRGHDSLRINRKGKRRDALAIHPNTAKRLKLIWKPRGVPRNWRYRFSVRLVKTGKGQDHGGTRIRMLLIGANVLCWRGVHGVVAPR